ncbi:MULTISPECIES: glycosyltransferase [Cyanophyceae]|uniref:glycosyltransferase n=1 Tax=Cyanophyceae TaxID=3028117 RepID=UPI0016822EE2|nr:MULTISPECIES: glycosyltransferase [Cyanophyceae]MBD1916325.1 glycosyltransferase [Phormidium sp. FACHB-77]MBD2032617.1 glycosyltransferase [Phormidium sp. FACHB-322]MBD2049989.1 glycosyltransferase [Leptolyngbya sp. FACHB-60]
MAAGSGEKHLIHFWVPNLFEFKGGIQVYLCDILLSIEQLYNQNNFFLDIVIIDKLDVGKPVSIFDVSCFSFIFTGKFPKSLQTLVFSLKALAIAFTHRPNLILCGHLNFAPVAYFLYRLLGIPYWVWVYGVDAWNIKNSLQCRALHAAEKVISISGCTRDRLVQEQGLSLSKISLLPVTFNVNRFQIQPKPSYLLDRHCLGAGQPVILTVARLAGQARHKGYDQILRTLPEIRRKIPDVHYVLVGKGCDKSRIENLIHALQLDDCVTLAGFVPDKEICDYYNLCDVFAMPSKGEGFGIVYLESLACGKPTVGGNQDGAVDALCNGELGVLVDPDDLAEIASTLVEILQGKSPHPILYRPKVLRQRVEAIYGFEKFQANWLNLIEKSNLMSS